MEEEQLRQTLDQLHRELEQNPKLAIKERERLQHLARDIETLLREDGKRSGQLDSVNRRLEAEIAEFELTHPALTQTMSRLLAILSSAGI